jgi:hypothetical protein
MVRKEKNRKMEFIILGIIIAFWALLLENIFNLLFSIQKENVLNELTIPLLSYVLIEEFLKLIVLKKKNTITASSKFIFENSFFLGLGFALTEIFHHYLLNTAATSNDLAPLLGIPTIHIATSVLIGYCLYKKTSFWLTLLLPIILHAFYNFLIIYNFDYFLVAIYLLVLVFAVFSVYFQLKNQPSANLPNS